jgi:hypothetical protein
MPSNSYKIASEFSAQRMSHPPNPSLPISLNALCELGAILPFKSAADLGCGKLRHYKPLSSISQKLFLVDTEEQLQKIHVDGKRKYTIAQFAEDKSKHNRQIIPLSFYSFSSMSLNIETIFCIAVFDVVLRKIRKSIISSAASNLRKGGFFVLIIPRNDASITDRCNGYNKYQDGHLFFHHGLYTFFKNYDSYSTIINDCKGAGLNLMMDVSNYRQVCLIFSI